MFKKIITIEGMHCGHCASTVENLFKDIEGITKSKVNLDKKVCTVSAKKDIDENFIREKIKESGFEVISIQTKKSIF